MRHDPTVDAGLNYAPCQYGASRLNFRGPPRNLFSPYLAFLGGTETYGKFIERPFATLTEERLGLPCVNLGIANASIDAYIHDPAVKDIAQRAQGCVVQITGAQSMSNRFYTVHPRRNDRFVRASTVLRAIYPEVDFAEICFTRHLLSTLWQISPDRFVILREELQAAWSARMRRFLGELGPRTLLLWFAASLPSDIPWEDRDDPLGGEPLFVTRRMVDALRPLVRAVVMVQPSARAAAQGTDGMVFTPLQEGAAAALPGPAAHEEAAEALVRALGDTLGDRAAQQRTHPAPRFRAAGSF